MDNDRLIREARALYGDVRWTQMATYIIERNRNEPSFGFYHSERGFWSLMDAVFSELYLRPSQKADDPDALVPFDMMGITE